MVIRPVDKWYKLGISCHNKYLHAFRHGNKPMVQRWMVWGYFFGRREMCCLCAIDQQLLHMSLSESLSTGARNEPI